jgi:hypothetical protein
MAVKMLDISGNGRTDKPKYSENKLRTQQSRSCYRWIPGLASHKYNQPTTDGVIAWSLSAVAQSVQHSTPTWMVPVQIRGGFFSSYFFFFHLKESNG